MTFISTYNNSVDIHLLALKIKFYGRWKIYAYKFGANEIALDNYIRTKYKTTLKQLCLAILQNTQVTTNNMDTIFSIISDKKYEQLAKFITYGNGKLYGSKILRSALTI